MPNSNQKRDVEIHKAYEEMEDRLLIEKWQTRPRLQSQLRLYALIQIDLKSNMRQTLNRAEISLNPPTPTMREQL